MRESTTNWLRFPWALLLLLGAGCSQPVDSPFEEVHEPGSNPGELRMFRYVPASGFSQTLPQPVGASSGAVESPRGREASNPGQPLVVALHGCMQDAAEYGEDSGWSRLADQWGFLLLLPEQRRSNNLARCFSWYSPEDHVRDAGEALSIRQMIARMRLDYAVDPKRIFVTGVSAGGAMSLVMAAVYPEVFAGAAPLAGIPFGCADGMFSGLRCMRSPPDKGAEEWGDAVRSASDQTGPWPRISVWQGDADQAVNPANATAIVRQWTNVQGIDLPAEEVNDPKGYLRTLYRGRDREVLVESYRIKGMGHGVSVDPGPGESQCGKESRFFPDMDLCSSRYIGRFWGLDRPADVSAGVAGTSGP